MPTNPMLDGEVAEESVFKSLFEPDFLLEVGLFGTIGVVCTKPPVHKLLEGSIQGENHTCCR